MHFYHQYWRLREAGASASVIDTYQEPWRDVDPGRLPRTRDEIRLGYQRSQYEMMIDTQQQHELLQSRQDDQTPHISVDDAIDQLLDEVESDVDDDNVMPEPTSSDAAAFVQTTSPLTYDLDPEIANTANQSISGYPEPLGSRLREWPTRLLRILSDSNDEAADAGARSGLALNQDSETPRVRRRLSAALSENPNLQIEVGTLESTVPDVNNTHQMPELPDLTQHAAQSASSPILNLLEEDPTIPVPEAPVRLTRQQMLNLILSAEVERRAQLEFLETMLQNASEGRQLLSHVADNVDQFDVLQTSRFARSNQRLGLDSLPRPEAVPDEAMTIRLECGICLQQVANIACVPCGHVVMCEWSVVMLSGCNFNWEADSDYRCAQIQLPLRTGTNTGALQGRPTCPKCRESVKTRVNLTRTFLKMEPLIIVTGQIVLLSLTSDNHCSRN